MPDGLEARLRWLFGGVAVVLVATGALALLVTSTAEPSLTSQSSQSSIDAQLRALVAGTLAGFVAAFAALGARVVWSPRRNTHLMPVFTLATIAAGAGAAVVAVQAWRAEATWLEPATVAATSLVLALASALGWLVLWLAERPGDATARRDAALFDALLATLVPPGEGLALDAQDALVRSRIVAAFAARSTRRRPALRLALRTLDALSLVEYRCRFDAADQVLRERIVARLTTSRRPRLRRLSATLNEIVLGAFWSDARVRDAVGDDSARLAMLLDSGPNAIAHRARREAIEQAAREAAIAAEPTVAALDDASSSAAASDATDAALAAASSQPAAEAAPAAHDESRAAQDELRGTRDGAPAREPLGDAPASAVEARLSAASLDAPVTVSASEPASDGPREIAPHPEELPFDRPWTIGVPAQEATQRPAMGPVLRVARAGGPTRR